MPLLDGGFINLGEYEIVPPPGDETPRQFLLRVTGKDFPDLSFDGRDYTWQEVKDGGVLPIILRILQTADRPHIRLRKEL